MWIAVIMITLLSTNQVVIQQANTPFKTQAECETVLEQGKDMFSKGFEEKGMEVKVEGACVQEDTKV